MARPRAITDEQVIEIRGLQATMTCSEIADRYGVDRNVMRYYIEVYRLPHERSRRKCDTCGTIQPQAECLHLAVSGRCVFCTSPEIRQLQPGG